LLFLFLGVYKIVAAGAIGDKFLSDISSQDLQLIATTPLTHFLFSHVVVLDVLSDRPTNFDILMMPTPWSEAEGAWWDGDVFSIGQSEGSEVVACLELLLGGLHHLGDERMLEHVSRVICWVLVNCYTQPHVSECKTLMSVTRKFLMSHDYHMMNKLHTFLATHLCQFVADSKDFHTLDGSRVDSSLAKPVEELLSVCASYLSRECGPSGVVGVGRDQSTFVSGMLEVCEGMICTLYPHVPHPYVPPMDPTHGPHPCTQPLCSTHVPYLCVYLLLPYRWSISFPFTPSQTTWSRG
jgi:hypothetical protein